MRKLAALIVFCLGIVLCANLALAGNKSLRVVPYPGIPSVACPMGSGFSDGCSGAQPTAVFQQPNAFQPGGFINTVSGTPTNYMANTCGGSGSAGPCRPQWNVAGVDYKIGYYSQLNTSCSTTSWASPSDCLMDPALLSSAGKLPSGCTYTATGNNGGPLLNCTSGWGGTLQHMNFGPINGHSCTQVSVNLTSAAPIVMDDFYFQNDSGLCGNTQGFALVISGSPLPATTPVLSNFVMDGNSTTYSTRYGPSSCISTITACNPRAAIFSDALVMKYGVVENFAADPINVAATPQTGQTLIEYSFVTGWNNRAPNNHTEWFAGPNGNTTGSPGVVSTEIQYTTAIAATNTSTFGPGMIFILSGFPVSTGAITLQNNVVVNQWAGGLTANAVSYTGCRGATFVSAGPPASCSGTGAKFFLTSGQAGWGTGLTGCGVNGNLGPSAGAPPSGATAVFWIDNGGVSTGYGDLGGNDQAAASCSGTFGTESAGDTAFVSGYGPHPAASISNTDNFIDASSYGTATPNLYVWGQNTVNAGTVTFLNSTQAEFTNALNGLNNNSYISASGVCPGDLTTCPFIPTGSSYPANTPLTINMNGASPPLNTPIASTTVGEATVCTTPITYSGNVDMAGLASSAYMNQSTKVISNVGC